MTTFRQLNDGWNAEPNAPNPQIKWEGENLKLTFYLNAFQFPNFEEEDLGEVTFRGCTRYRLGDTNDEGWYRGQCRFSGIAPKWGEFYELAGDLKLDQVPDGWVDTSLPANAQIKHFLFYFRDDTFECDAVSWEFSIKNQIDPPQR